MPDEYFWGKPLMVQERKLKAGQLGHSTGLPGRSG